MSGQFHLRRGAFDDAAGLAELILLADQAHYASSGYAISLGGTRDYQWQQLAKLTQAGAPSQFHYSHFDVAVAEGGTVAAAVAAFDRAATDSRGYSALEQIGWNAEAIEALMERIGPVAASFPADEPGSWTIEHVATLPQYRGLGLASALLERAIARGAEQGFRQAVVDVFAGNSKACAVYEALGFRQTLAFGHEPLRRILDRDPLIRLVRPLG